MGGLIGAAVASAGCRRGQRRHRRHQGADPRDRRPARRRPRRDAGHPADVQASASNADAKATAKGYRAGQIASAGLVSLAHGTNDAQKTMGIITLALVTGGVLAPGSNPPIWVIVSAGLAIALGTYLGGWRIIRTMGKGLTDLQPQQGFAAQTSAATVILASSHLGFSLSTTQSCSGAVMGAGLGRKGGVVRWSTATRMFVAWGLTLPAAGLVAAGAEFVTKQGDWGVARRRRLPGRRLRRHLAALPPQAGRPHQRQRRPDAEPAGVVTTAIAAVTPPPGRHAPPQDLKTTIPAPAPRPTRRRRPDAAAPRCKDRSA